MGYRLVSLNFHLLLLTPPPKEKTSDMISPYAGAATIREGILLGGCRFRV